MMNSLKKIALVILLSGIGFFVYGNYLSVCSQPMEYAVGNIDPRFGITADQFATLAQETESVWESPMASDFFRYNPDATFKINLVFDDRQQRTIDERESRTAITTNEQQYRADVQAYEERLAEHNKQNSEYDAAVIAYEQRLQKYNQDVEYWNQNGGAPAKEFSMLQQEKSYLQRESRRLEAERQKLNLEVSELNVMVASINERAKDLNLNVDAYNGKFGTSREFDQGTYTGSEINIYQFSALDDLKLVLAHEFGHALGIDHVEDPEAIMYYLMDKQNIKNLQLSEGDVSAVKRSCNL